MNVTAQLQQLFASGKPSHAYVIECQKSVAKSLLTACARVAMCQNYGCGECVTCKKISQGNHADCISLPTDTQKNKLTVADVQMLVEESIKRPVDSGNVRVFTIDATDSVTGVGSAIWQNKLLKTLEEPLAGVYIFIAVENANSLFNTVLSRCQVLTQAKALPRDICATLVKNGFQSQYAQVASSMACDVDHAKKLVADNSVFDAFNLAMDMLRGMTSSKTALPYVSQICQNKGVQDKILSMLTLLLRESVTYRLNPQLCLLVDYEQQLLDICANYSIQAALVCIEKLNQTNKRLSNGGNFAVEMDKLAIEMSEVKYRCRI